MADHKYKVVATLPVYKDQSTPSNKGVKLAPGDTVTFIKKSSDGSLPTQDVVITNISDSGKTLHWEYDSASVFLHPNDIYAIHPKHTFVCAPFINVGATSLGGTPAAPDKTVSAFTINGESFSGSYAVSGPGAASLQAAIQAALDALEATSAVNGREISTVRVTFIDSTTDYLRIVVFNTNATITVTDADATITLTTAGIV